MIGIYVLAAIVVLALIFVKKTIVIIPQSETKIIERLGRYYATLRLVSTSLYHLSTVPRRLWPCAMEDICTPTLSTCVNRCTISTDRT